MFLLFGLFFAPIIAAYAVVSAFVSLIMAGIKFLVRQVLLRVGLRDNPGWDYILFRHIDWARAIRSQEDYDAEIERLTTELEDNDGNGIPDLYDADVTDPSMDFLGIKYPQRFLIDHDYVRYLPRALGALPQPVSIGAKGLVLSETWYDATGAYAWVKWNALNPMGPVDAPLWKANQMDLYKIGHVSAAGQKTR